MVPDCNVCYHVNECPWAHSEMTEPCTDFINEEEMWINGMQIIEVEEDDNTQEG